MSDCDHLVQRFASNSGSLFVGAGISVSAGLPTWSQLITPLRESIPDCPEDALLIDVAKYYEDQWERNALTELIRQRLQPWEVRPTPVHHALVNMPHVRRIFTTNLDDLLEQAARKDRRPFKVVSNRSAVRLTPDQLNVIKVHGDVHDDESYVITSRDYENYATKYRQVVQLMSFELQQQTILFVGYSFSDIDLRMILSEARAGVNAPAQHYILQPNPSKAVKKDLDGRGLRVVEIECGKEPDAISKAVCEWLKKFASRIGGDSSVSGASAGTLSRPPVRHNLPPSATAPFFGRESDVASILAALAGEKPIVSVQGVAGVGKTTLAQEVALRCLPQSEKPSLFDYAVWVSANKPEQKRWFDDVARAVYLVVAPQQRLVQTREFPAELTRLFSSSAILLIIDNFEYVDDPPLVEWIAQIPNRSKVLLTTRENITGPHVTRVLLNGLDSVDAMDLARDQARVLGVLENLNQNHDEARKLVTSTGGNPQQIKLAIGLLTDATVTEVTDSVVATSIDTLFAASWDRLSDDARKVLLTFPVFTGLSSLRYEALQTVSGLNEASLDAALGELVAFKLIEHDFRTSRFVTHSRTRELAFDVLQRNPGLLLLSRNACIAYLFDLIRQHVVREAPSARYWNALVTDSMSSLDPEWPCIDQMFTWLDEAGQADQFIDLVMLLVHYMNSRIRNEERIRCVNRAIEHARAAGKTDDEALLRIDALGWTYLEENRLDDAESEILAGRQIADHSQSPNRTDLLNLAHAWRARVLAERGDLAGANREIAGAQLFRSNPWICFRVNMAAGDIALKQDAFGRAYECFTRCNQDAETYGGEGHGYQIEPRLGLACVRLNQLDEAREHFGRLQRAARIPLGRLYGDYGLALVALREERIDDARALAEPVREKLQQTNSGLILTLMNKAYEDLLNSDCTWPPA